MKLRLEFTQHEGDWKKPYPTIEENGYEYFLDPNDDSAIRIRPPEHPGPWMQFNLSRLTYLHAELLKARRRAA